MLEKVGEILISGCDRRCTFSMRNCFPHDIIVFPLDYKILKKSQLAHFCSMKFTFNRCVWSKNNNIHLKYINFGFN